MIFRQWLDAESSTYTYLLADERSRRAVLIDPVRENVERDLTQLRELGLTLAYVLDTHTHADHVTAAGALRERTGALTVAGESAAPCVSLRLRDGEVLQVGELAIRAIATPGHTNDSVSYLAGDRVFTGDCLLIRAVGRTDFQNGNPEQQYDSITRKLFSLPEDTLVFPGHDYHGLTVSSIGEEKRFNPRIANRTLSEFVEIMGALGLPAPKRLAEAVPANRACGLEQSGGQG
jgi:glyoxylase-like metal-dependent hydrolase (beta-lactamase superfamily II)